MAEEIEQWKQVEPAMFEDTIEQELGKYERFREEIENGSERQEELIGSIRVGSFYVFSNIGGLLGIAGWMT